MELVLQIVTLIVILIGLTFSGWQIWLLKGRAEIDFDLTRRTNALEYSFFRAEHVRLARRKVEDTIGDPFARDVPFPLQYIHECFENVPGLRMDLVTVLGHIENIALAVRADVIDPAVVFNMTISIVFAMQSFSEPYLLQNRQQDDGLLFYMLYLYEVAFEPPYRLGYASALAWILVAVLVVLIVPLMWSSRRWVHYATSK